MRLPNGDRASVDIAKLRDYCLDTSHWRGRHKARVFATALGITAADAEWLRDALIAAARAEDAIPSDADQYGQRFVVEFELIGPMGTAMIRSRWIVRTGEDYPRLSTCYVV